MVLALKLCRRPSEWPTSCMTISLIAWPTNSSGSSSLGCGFFLSASLGLSLSLPLSSAALGWSPAAARAIAARPKSRWKPGLDWQKPASPADLVLGQLPGEEVLIGRHEPRGPARPRALSSASRPSRDRPCGWP